MSGIEQLSGILTDAQESNISYSSPYSLEHKLIAAYAENSSKYDLQKQHVMNLVSNTNSTSSPEALFAIQQKTADYNIEISLISALTRKATSAVETLLRA